MGRRSRLEIYLDVLRVIKRGTRKPTRIMYSTNLSWKPLREILDSMIAQDLIEERHIKRSKRYEITEKGMRVISYFSKMREDLVIPGLKMR